MNFVYPGSFDPVTRGHVDIMHRAAKVCDRLIVGVLENVEKTPLFTAEERIRMILEAVDDIPNLEVKAFSGFAVEFAAQNNAAVIVRGLRGAADFAYEQQLAQINRSLNPEIDTVFFSSELPYTIVSSSGAKEIAKYGGDVSEFVPPAAAARLKDKYNVIQEIKK